MTETEGRARGRAGGEAVSETRETYLGDGLYASFDGWQIVLRAPRSEGDHYVALEPEVVVTLLEFIAGLKATAAALADKPSTLPESGCVSRKEVIEMLRRKAAEHAELAIVGEPSNARIREGMEAAFKEAEYAVAFMPPTPTAALADAPGEEA